MSTPEFLNPDTMAAPEGPYAHAAWVKAGSDLLFIAGQVGVRPDGTLPDTLPAQAKEAYANIARVLAAAGLTTAHLVKLNTFVVAGQALAGLAPARRQALGDVRPAATFVFVPQLIEPKYLIEIEAVAAR